MNHHYGIDTSVFVRLLTGDPEIEYQKTVRRFEERLVMEPQAEFFVSNQVIGEAYIALQHHYGISKSVAKSALIQVLTSGLCSPLYGATVIEALQTEPTVVAGCSID
jgi:predicted nucleic acid-binding protein